MTSLLTISCIYLLCWGFLYCICKVSFDFKGFYQGAGHQPLSIIQSFQCISCVSVDRGTPKTVAQHLVSFLHGHKSELDNIFILNVQQCPDGPEYYFNWSNPSRKLYWADWYLMEWPTHLAWYLNAQKSESGNIFILNVQQPSGWPQILFQSAKRRLGNYIKLTGI